MKPRVVWVTSQNLHSYCYHVIFYEVIFLRKFVCLAPATMEKQQWSNNNEPWVHLKNKAFWNRRKTFVLTNIYFLLVNTWFLVSTKINKNSRSDRTSWVVLVFLLTTMILVIHCILQIAQSYVMDFLFFKYYTIHLIMSRSCAAKP